MCYPVVEYFYQHTTWVRKVNIKIQHYYTHQQHHLEVIQFIEYIPKITPEALDECHTVTQLLTNAHWYLRMGKHENKIWNSRTHQYHWRTNPEIAFDMGEQTLTSVLSIVTSTVSEW